MEERKGQVKSVSETELGGKKDGRVRILFTGHRFLFLNN